MTAEAADVLPATAEERDRSAIDWLLRADEPAVRFLTRTDVLGQKRPRDASGVLDGPKVRRLFADQRADGGFGVHAYQKWTGAHWRLVSLVELGIPRGEPRALAAADTVLAWLLSPHRSYPRMINGLPRTEASQEGNALAVCVRLGMADDARVRRLAESLIAWQWPDGGWNCDPRASGRRSSFNETLPAMWGLHEFAVATREAQAAEAADRAAELFLEHRIFRSLKTGEPIHPNVVQIHYPPYWHYDFLQALLILGRMDRLRDRRTDDAFALLGSLRRADGRWAPNRSWWRPPGSGGSNVEVVDWGRLGPSEMLTLNALRVLRMRR
ncbi:MAG: hypothetical protein ABR509_06920 [Candidatus Limnocylindria bacterium]